MSLQQVGIGYLKSLKGELHVGSLFISSENTLTFTKYHHQLLTVSIC